MFWGLIMEPNKRYTQTVEKAFHLSMASLDASTASGGLVQVMICYDNRNYLLCTLQKGLIWQVPLDLNFQEGTKIAFTCNGDGHVHLTGYLVPEDEGLDELDDFEEDEEEEEEDDEEIPILVGQKKRKALNSPKEKNDMKRAKKSKVEVEDEDDDDESDSDLADGTLDIEDDSDDDDLDGEEDDEDESDDDDEEEEEKVETPVKPSKKQKQKQNQSNQQTQQNHQQNQSQPQAKKGKDKLVNGKDAKPEKEGKQKKNKENSKTEDKPEPQKRRTVEGGVQVEDVKVGEGAPAKSGKFISVYYIGRLKNGKKFDQTQQGEGFKFRLGKGEVIKGWDVGIVGMKIGGKRRITIPPNMAYGAKGSPPVIPPNSILNFDIELKAIH